MGRTFFVQQAAQFAPRFRARALLRITTTPGCPVTLPNANRPPRQPRHVTWYGNGVLWEPDGIDTVTPDRIVVRVDVP